MSLTLDFQDNVAVLTHDDGKRNAFSPDCIRATAEFPGRVEGQDPCCGWNQDSRSK